MKHNLTIIGMITTMSIMLMAGTRDTNLAKPEPKQETKTGTVTVESVEGPAQYRVTSKGKDKWVAVKKGDKLSELTVIRTGFGGKVVLHLRDDTRVTVLGGTKMGIRRFRQEGKLTRTRVGLGYGAIRAKIDSTRNPNDFKVEVHDTTLAVTGTAGYIGWAFDAGLILHSTEHTWLVSNKKGSKHVAENMSTDDELAASDEMTSKYLDTLQGDTKGLTVAEKDHLRKLGRGRDIFSPSGDDPTRAGVDTRNGGKKTFSVTP